MIRRKLEKASVISEIRNAHWECLDCADSWKAPLDRKPTKCREYSVGKDGNPSNKPGCGSINIRRKINIQRGMPKQELEFADFDDIIAGAAAYVSGIQLKPLIDWEMGENDVEAEVRPERRELAINGRHPAFRAAETLGGSHIPEGTDLESLVSVGALIIHTIDVASLAWGQWHYEKAGGRLSEFSAHYAELKNACLKNVRPIGSGQKESTAN